MLILCMACCVLEMAFRHSCEAQQVKVNAMSLEDGHPEGVMAAQLVPFTYSMMPIDSSSLTGFSFLCWSLFPKHYLRISIC